MARRGLKGKDDGLDCTAACCLAQHASLVLSCVALGNLRLVRHCASVCGNPFRITDPYGRNALHVAASLGHLHVVEWLLAKKRVGVDLCDFESRWGALHRSIYFGQLGVAVALIKKGASLVIEDLGGLNPLNLLNGNKSLLTATPAVSAVSVYTWGSNPNVSLGHEHSKEYPELLEVNGRHTIMVVILCKFHSVFLTREGRVLTCGHGQGGRLGHGSEHSVVAPSVVEALRRVKCVAIAAARDHTAVLDERGTLYTFGLNDAHQLGHGTTPTNAPPFYSAPKPVTQKLLRNKAMISVGVGRFHTATCTSTEVYTFGKNLGQLGYEKSSVTQVTPRAVPQVVMDDDDSITLLSVSDAATACLTKKHRIFVCMGYTVKSIRCGFFEKAACVQFSVCASLSDLDHLRKTQTEPTKVLMLDSDHQMWFWQPQQKGSVPSPLHSLSRHKVTQFHLGKSLTVVTVGGEVYTGAAVVPLGVTPSLTLTRVPMAQNAQAVFTDFKSNNWAYIQDVYRSPELPKVAPSTLSHDLSALLEEACLPDSVADIEIEVGKQVFTAHKFILASASPLLASLLFSSATAQLPPSIKSFSPTKLILRDCEPSIFESFLYYLYCSHLRLIPSCSRPLDHAPPTSDSIDQESTPDTSLASVDENDLSELYDRYGMGSPRGVLDSSGGLGVSFSDSQSEADACHTPIAVAVGAARGQSTPKKRSHRRSQSPPDLVCEVEPVRELHCSNTQRDVQTLVKLARDFEVPRLKSSLEDVRHTLSLKHIYDPVTLTHSRPYLNRKAHPTLSDLVLMSEDGQELHCHRCVLVARSEYFRSMLLMGWRESSAGTESLSLPVSYHVLKTVIDFMYTDQAKTVTAASGPESIEWVTSVLVVADQLLITRLKDQCESALANSLSLRNVAEMLEFSVAYSALQLKKACLKFMCVNASVLLEGRNLENLGTPLLNELSAAYQELLPAIRKRVIKFPEPDLSSLPESYFLEDDFPSDEVNSEGEEPEDSFSATPISRDDRDSMRSPTAYDTPSTGKTLTPVSSSSRKRRRRKTSQSDSRRPSNAAGSPDHTPQAAEDNKETDGKASPELTAELLSPSHTEKPFQKVRRKPRTKLLNRFDETTSSNGKGLPDKAVNGMIGDGIASPVDANTSPKHPIEAAEVNGKQDKLVGQVHQPSLKPPKEERGWNRADNSSSPSQAGGAAWSWTSVSGNPGGSSLRDIMEQEEKLARQQAENKSPPQNPPGHTSSSLAGEKGRGTARKSSSSLPAQPGQSLPQPVPCKRQGSVEDRGSPRPSPSSAQSPPNPNPWKGAGVATSPVSMRDLMAEEAKWAAKENLQHRSLVKVPPVNRPLENMRPGGDRKQPPVMVPHRRVSFADIVHAQELEQEDQKASTGKPLSLIQASKLFAGQHFLHVAAKAAVKPGDEATSIEEQAIQELGKQYSAQDNPDEYITVERSHLRSRTPWTRSLSHDSPWS